MPEPSNSVDALIQHQNETGHDDCEWRPVPPYGPMDGEIWCYDVEDGKEQA